MRARSSRSPVRAAAICGWFARSLAWAALLLAAVARPVRADIQEPIAAHTQGERVQRRTQRRELVPANGNPQEVQVHQGESIEIVLTAHGQPGKTIAFAIRTPPEHGRIEGPPRQLTRNTASVTYVHRAADGAGNDVFSYAVQTAGSAVSAAVPVSITVLGEPPNLVATPAELDFGTVKTGETTRATLTLENRGGGTAVGRVEPPPPWTVDGAVEYHLGHGETQSFQIVFQPPYGQAYVEGVHVRSEAGQDVRLIGSGVGPVDPSLDPAARRVIPADGIVRSDGSTAPPAVNLVLPPPVAVSPPPVVVPATPVPAPVAVVAAAPPDVPAADIVGTAGNDARNLTPPVGSVVVNQAAVKTLDVSGVGTSTFDLAWTPPRPTPKAYRVELRYLSMDQDERLRVDWRPYAKVDILPTQARVTARVSGLPSGTRQTVRVVAVDDAGRLAPPSASAVVETRLASTWWHITPLKVLIFLLLCCGAALIYKKWEERQILRDVDARRAAREADLMYRR